MLEQSVVYCPIGHSDRVLGAHWAARNTRLFGKSGPSAAFNSIIGSSVILEDPVGNNAVAVGAAYVLTTGFTLYQRSNDILMVNLEMHAITPSLPRNHVRGGWRRRGD